jgi:hypothetical protein
MYTLDSKEHPNPLDRCHPDTVVTNQTRALAVIDDPHAGDQAGRSPTRPRLRRATATSWPAYRTTAQTLDHHEIPRHPHTAHSRWSVPCRYRVTQSTRCNHATTPIVATNDTKPSANCLLAQSGYCVAMPSSPPRVRQRPRSLNPAYHITIPNLSRIKRKTAPTYHHARATKPTTLTATLVASWVVVAHAIEANFPPAVWNQAAAVSWCESGYDQNALSPPNTNGTRDHGLFQLNDGGTLQSLLSQTGQDPANVSLAADGTWNASAAGLLYNQRGWEPWTCAAHDNIVAGLYSSAPGPNATGPMPAQYLPQGFPVLAPGVPLPPLPPATPTTTTTSTTSPTTSTTTSPTTTSTTHPAPTTTTTTHPAPTTSTTTPPTTTTQTTTTQTTTTPSTSTTQTPATTLAPSTTLPPVTLGTQPPTP